MLRWIALGCLLVVAAIQDPTDKIKLLIANLESDDISVREQAVKDITAVGSPALPALRMAAASSSGERKILLQRIIDVLTVFGRPIIVTIEAVNRPMKEIAADLEKQSGVPIRTIGEAGNAKVSVSLKKIVVWKAIEEACRSHGNLMYRFIDDTVEIYPSRFRTLPSVDVGALRFFIDRFDINENPPWKNAHFLKYGAVLAPPGARLVRIECIVDECVDDLGNDSYKKAKQNRAFIFDGFSVWPRSSRMLYPLSFNEMNEAPPPLEASKIARLQGRIEVWLAQGEKILKSIPNPLASSSTEEEPTSPSLGIKSWILREDWLFLRYTATWDLSAVSFLNNRLGPRLYLRWNDGSWGPSWEYSCNEESYPEEKEVKKVDRTFRMKWPKGAVAQSLDLVAPHPILKVEIPFDFRDIPLR